MAKTYIVRLLVSAVLAAPILASAEVAIPTQPSVEQLLSRVAALISMRDSVPVACSMFASTRNARAGQPYTIWWGSFGSVPDAHPGVSQWSPSGATTIVANKRGVYEYKFTFYGQDAASTTCKTLVSVS